MSSQKVSLSDGCTLLVKILNPDEVTKSLFIIHHSALGAADHTETESSYGFLVSRFRVLVFDARGCGVSDATEPLENSRWVEDIEELRQWAKAVTFYLAGNSYGAMISLQYAAKYPSNLKGLLLRAGIPYGPFMKEHALQLASTSSACSPDMERQRRLWSGQLRDNRDYAASWQDITPLFAIPGQNSEKNSPEENYDEQEESDGGGLRYETHNAAFSRNLPYFDVRSRLKDIPVPTLVTVGKHDWLTPVECAKEICEGIPGAELEIFEGSCHNPPVEAKEAFQRRVWEWVDKLGV